VLAAMLADGRLAGHLAALRQAYAAKRDTLVDALATHCGDMVVFDRPAGGMFVWARCRADVPLLDTEA
jgi:DNA-binding transcriptional MocR family regulator